MLKTSSRHVLKTSSRRLEDQQMFAGNPHPACAIYDGVCTCKENYIGETKQNAEIRWEEHSGINKISEPYRRLKAMESLNDSTN